MNINELKQSNHYQILDGLNLNVTKLFADLHEDPQFEKIAEKNKKLITEFYQFTMAVINELKCDYEKNSNIIRISNECQIDSRKLVEALTDSGIICIEKIQDSKLNDEIEHLEILGNALISFSEVDDGLFSKESRDTYSHFLKLIRLNMILTQILKPVSS